MEWLPIPEFPNYEASDQGRIRNRLTGYVRKPSPTKSGVSMVLPDGNGIQRCFAVGSLVLRAWVGLPPTGTEASHLDGNPANNHVANLAWESHADNMARKWTHGTVLSGDKHGMTKLSDVDVATILTRLGAGEMGAALAREYGVHPTRISQLKLGKGRVCLRVTER